MLLDDYEEENRRPRWVKPALTSGGVVVVAALVAAVIAGVMQDTGPRKKPVVQQIAVVRPPPPPPPPKPEEKLPEPEIKEEVKVPEPEQPQPEQASEQPPPGDQLGVDAAGSGTRDSFGLVGRPGGQDITTIGGGGGGDRFAYFAGVLERRLLDTLNRNDKLKARDYSVVLRVWIEASGRIERYELSGSSGNPETDSAIRAALASAGSVGEPPADLPQPVRLRVTSRGAG